MATSFRVIAIEVGLMAFGGRSDLVDCRSRGGSAIGLAGLDMVPTFEGEIKRLGAGAAAALEEIR